MVNPQPPDEPARNLTRRRRLAAGAMDGATGALAFAAGLVLAVAWLLLRTGAGRTDVGDGDAAIAVSLIAATAPAWATWVVLHVRRHGATPGQRLAGLVVQPAAGAPRWARYARMALHPLSALPWGWLALGALLTGLPWLPLLPALAAAGVALAGGVSFVMLLARPRSRALHDRLSRTALVPRT